VLEFLLTNIKKVNECFKNIGNYFRVPFSLLNSHLLGYYLDIGGLLGILKHILMPYSA